MNLEFTKNMKNRQSGSSGQKMWSMKVKDWGLATVVVNGEKLTVSYPEYDEEDRR